MLSSFSRKARAGCLEEMGTDKPLIVSGCRMVDKPELVILGPELFGGRVVNVLLYCVGLSTDPPPSDVSLAG